MSDPARDLSRCFTFRDYLSWPEEERWELIEGEAFSMAPAPSLRHQELVVRLAAAIHPFLRGKPCKLFVAPVDVLLPRPGQAEEEVDTVVEPDLVVVCDPAKLRGAYILGAPDLVVEALSPRTSKRDLNDKLRLYERSGVREYWAVEARAGWLHRYARSAEAPEAGFGEPLVRERGDGEGRFASLVIEGLDLELEELFAE